MRAVIGISVALVACASGGRSAPAPRPASAVGTWRGTSTCLVRPSACHDETVVYHFTQQGESLAAAANKIVDGTEQPMGDLTCSWAADTRTVRCPIEKGVFTFVIDGDHMTGRLELTDGTAFRTIDAQRAR